MDKKHAITKHLEESIRVKSQIDLDMLVTIADVITRAFKRGKKVLLFGNGGSATDAQHIAGEFLGKFSHPRPPLPAIALTTDFSSITAIANDFGYESVFARQLEALAAEGDVVIGISTSGKSPNVLQAIRVAKEKGAITVAFTGMGGKLKELADYALCVPSEDTQRIQEAHITAGHLICYLVDVDLYGESS